MHAFVARRNQLTAPEELVPQDHPFRECERVIDIRALAKSLHDLYSNRGCRETGSERGLRMHVLQFMLDLSDREMELFMSDSNTARRLSGFGLRRGRPTIPGSASSVGVSEPRVS